MATRAHRRIWAALIAALLAAGLATVGAPVAPSPAGASPRPVGPPASETPVQVAAGGIHTCARMQDGSVYCWGGNNNGELGYGNTDYIGDNETPGAAGPIDLGAGRTAVTIAAGDTNTCAILDDASVKCWGQGETGALGTGNTDNIGDDETPAGVQPVDLGAGRTATAIAAGLHHTCAILDNGTVLCFGDGGQGRLGYGNTNNIGDNESPGSIGPVNLGAGRTAVAIDAGESHTCAILDDGSVRCWGVGSGGKLGYGNQTTIGDNETPGSVGPVNLGAGRTATRIVLGGNHTCAVLDDGTVRCWGGGAAVGYGNGAAIGDNEAPGSVGPVNLGAGRTATAITANYGHNCVVLDDGTVRCWGFAGSGQLGYGDTESIGDDELPSSVGPVNLGAGRTATAIAAGDEHSCALLDDASIRCWGDNNAGQLGYGNDDSIGGNENQTPDTAGPVDFSPPKLSIIKAADETEVFQGQPIHFHITVTNLSDAPLTGIEVQDENAPACAQAVPDLAVGEDHTVDCTYTPTEDDAGNTYQNIASATADQATSPTSSNTVDVEVAYPPIGISLETEQTVVTAGDDITFFASVENNSEDPLTGIVVTDPNAPDCAQPVPDLDAFDSYDYECTYTTTVGDVGTYTNAASVTANEVALTFSSTPVNVAVRDPNAVPIGATAVTGGESHSCALLVGGEVKCWGVNWDGRLGLGLTEDDVEQVLSPEAYEPVDFGAGRTVTAIDAGNSHTCALLDDATVRCWGNNYAGELGYGNEDDIGDDETPAEVGPVDFGGGRTATAITGGSAHTCALLDDGTIKCWGYAEFGELGYGNTDNIGDDETLANVQPVDLGGGRTATAIAAGPGHTCAILDDGNVKCWGLNTNGQLGYGNTDNIGDDETPASVGTVNLGVGRTATTLAAGYSHTCAILDDGSVRCWGDGGQGQLGYGNTTSIGDNESPGSAGPVDLGAGRTAVALDAGDGHTCAILDDGALRCWGDANRVGLPDDEENIGDDETPGSVDPVDFGNGRTVTALGAGPNHTCAVLDNGRVRCWGAGGDGQLGDSSDEFSQEPADPVELGYTTPPPIPPGHGMVSGTVTQAGSGNPIGGAVVAVLSTATYSPVGIAIADAAGDYATLVPVGTYFVYVIDPAGAHAAGFFGGPTLVSVTDGDVTDADPELSSTRGTIAGTVTEHGTGTPLADVVALSTNLTENGRPGAGDLTDSNGQYVINDLSPSDRLVAFVDLSGAHSSEYHDDVPTPIGAQIITVTGNATATVDAGLPAQTAPSGGAHLVGDVTSTQTGADLADVAVFALRTSDYSLVGGDLTDAAGRYDLALDPGAYKLAFYDPTGAHLMEWHDNRPYDSPLTADSVTATTGTPLETDAALTPVTGTASGTVTDTASGSPLTGIKVIATDDNGTVVGVATTTTDGTYTLNGLEPGDYRFRFTDLTGAHIDEYHDNAPDYAGATPITITAGVVTTGINAALA